MNIFKRILTSLQLETKKYELQVWEDTLTAWDKKLIESMELSPTSLKQDQLGASIPSWAWLEPRIFIEEDGKFFIGGNELTAQERNLLREQARYLKTSQLWETMDSVATNEAIDIALAQSKDFDQVRTAKMLHHWNYVFKNLIYRLAK